LTQNGERNNEWDASVAVNNQVQNCIKNVGNRN
jgi:hypothetical protein